MRLLIASLLVFFICASFDGGITLKGVWEFRGGIYNGKREGAPTEYSLQRRYSDKNFKAYLLEKGNHNRKYEAGNYELKGDSCIETQTFSSEPSDLMNIPVHYHYEIRNDTLVLKTRLPSGMAVEEYWKKLK